MVSELRRVSRLGNLGNVENSSFFHIALQLQSIPVQLKIAENENNSDLSSEETGAPSVDKDIQVSENVEQTASEPSVQKLQQMAPQHPLENLVRMALPPRKPPTTKSTKRSRTNDESR
ncbi:hypothetical protein JTB14_014325 [Gonioctena quinquepunctata]|nr:hypothetical protein JTB14_014325 [Gonioctena quinquepunctata]